LLSRGFIPCPQRVCAQSQICSRLACDLPGFRNISLPAESAATKRSSDPWSSSQALQAADLAGEARSKKWNSSDHSLRGLPHSFRGGHIPGASFHGAPPRTRPGRIKKWADSLPRSTNLVIYCGCCPFEKCPTFAPIHRSPRHGVQQPARARSPTNFAPTGSARLSHGERNVAELHVATPLLLTPENFRQQTIGIKISRA